jgi:hypothetical protein
MVVASGKASQESALNYMRAVTDMYKNALRGISTTMTPFEMMKNMMSSAPGTPAEQLLQEQIAAAATGPQSLPAPQVEEKEEIEELKRRIQELEAMVLNLGKTPSAHKKKAHDKTSS